MQMTKPLVSVLMPAYNHENYVQYAINSVMASTYQNIELIVIDDGSKDRTYEKIIELKPECEKRFTRVIMDTQANSGTCRTLNRMLSLAKGEFVFLIASDDAVKPQAVEKMCDFLSSHPEYVLAVGDNEFIDGDSNVVGCDCNQNVVDYETAEYKTFFPRISSRMKSPDDFGKYEVLLKANHVPNGYLMRKSVMPEFTPEAPLEDFYMHLQLSKTGKFHFFDEVFFSYRQHGTNTMKRKEYIKKIHHVTMVYEEKLVRDSGDKELLETFHRQTTEIKIKFQIGNILKYFRRRSYYGGHKKEYIVEIFRRQFVIKTKIL